VQPLSLFASPSAVLPAVAYSMTFLLASVLTTVEIPQLFGPRFHFNAQQLGLQFIALIVGSVIGEQLGGLLSDGWMARRAHKLGGARPPPEYRLWLSYLGFVAAIVGLVVFLVRIDQIRTYDVGPIVGAGVAAGGVQIVTTVLITYAVDCHSDEAASVGVFITFVRQIWGFIGPFW